MELNKPATSGAEVPTSGGADNSLANEGQSTSGDNTSHVEKLLREKKNTMEALRKSEEARKKLEEEKLIANQQWKEIAEASKREAEEIKTKYMGLEENLRGAKVNSVLRDELVRLGLNAEHIDTALKLTDKSLVQVDSDTGVVIGAAEAAKAFQTKHASLGFFNRRPISGNHPAPSMNIDKQKTLAEMTMQEKAELLASMSKK